MGLPPFGWRHRQHSETGIGIKKFSPGIGEYTAPSPTSKTAPNPNPYRFEIEDISEHGNYTVAMIRYPDATTFDGVKILVFAGKKKRQLERAREIDPHLLPSNDIVARVRPDRRGMAVLAKILQ